MASVTSFRRWGSLTLSANSLYALNDQNLFPGTQDEGHVFVPWTPEVPVTHAPLCNVLVALLLRKMPDAQLAVAFLRWAPSQKRMEADGV